MIPVQTPRFGEWLRKLFGGRGGFGLTLLDDVMPYVDVLSERPDIQWMRREHLWQAGTNLPAPGVGLNATLEVRNPTGSGKLVTVQRIIATVDAADTVTFGITTGAILGAALNPVPARDGRDFPVTLATSAAMNGIAGPFGTQTLRLGANAPIVFDVNAVLSPGVGFGISRGTANLLFTVAAFGSERDMTPEELQA